MADRIVLATFGTHGDLNPFIGIAIALRQVGLDPVIASHCEYRPLVETAGIRFHALRPARAQLDMNSDAGRTQIMRAARRRPQLILTRYVLPYLEQSHDDALEVVRGASLVFLSSLSFGARLAAETLGVPRIAVVLQPGMMGSAYDPPLLGTNCVLNRLLRLGGPPLYRVLIRGARLASRQWLRPVDRLRSHLGLSSDAHPLFEGQWSGSPVVGLYSSVLGGPQPDHPPDFTIAGFSFFDGDDELPPALRLFLAAGSPPLVFTLGTSAVHDSDHFVEVALRALTSLSERAVLILDDAQRKRWHARLPEQVIITGYVPYSKVFPHARAIIHHGGIGTTAQALRAGRPQLIAPYFVDQPDNAARVARLGSGLVLPLSRWTPRRLIAALRSLSDPQLTARAAQVASHVTEQQGAATTAALALRVLRSRTQFTDLPVPAPMAQP